MIGPHIQLILMVTGVITAGAFGIFLAPATLLRWVFGEVRPSAVGLMVTRHWGLLVAGVGVLLVHAALHPAVRPPILAFAVIEKLVIGALILGTSLRRHRLAAFIAVADLLMALLYVLYWAGV